MYFILGKACADKGTGNSVGRGGRMKYTQEKKREGAYIEMIRKSIRR